MGLVKGVGRSIRWFENRLVSWLIVVAVGALSVRGDLRALSLPAIVTAFTLIMLLGIGIWRQLADERDKKPDEIRAGRAVFHLELLALSALYFMLHLTGGIASPLYPFLYIFLAAVGGFDSSFANRGMMVGCAWGLELLTWYSDMHAPVSILGVHLTVIVAFPFVVGALEWTWLSLERRKREQHVKAMMQMVDRQAEEYRFSGLTAAQEQNLNDAHEQNRRKNLQRSSVKQLGIGVANMVGVLEAALRPHTIAVYWLSVDEKTLTLIDAITTDEHSLRPSMDSKEGILGVVVQRRDSICRNHLDRTQRWFGYYHGDPPKLKSFMGVPLMELVPGGNDAGIGHLRGVLIADRKVDVPFGEDDEKLMRVVGHEILRIWKTERQLNRMDVIKSEARGLYDASEGLIKAVGLRDVIREVASSLRGIYTEADLVCVVLRCEEDSSLVIEAVDVNQKLESWKRKQAGQKLPKTHHLCDLAVRKGIIVPDAAFDKRIRSQRKIFGENQDPVGIRSVKVVPLKLPNDQEENIGVLVVGSSSSDYFQNRIGRFEDVKRTLETLSNIATISIQNAKRYERLETMATTDALTGLYNRRMFFENLDTVLAESRRYGRPLSLILTDVDHFKQVNDTYGHPKGDEVLKQVAEILREQARETDHVCRYGGEEFAVIMPQTDKMGAILLAERFRTEIKKKQFQYKNIVFNVSLSFGVCTYPHSASSGQELIQKSDQALYRAKRAGRDRVVHFAD